MSVIIFILVLSVLVFVHELGHFLAAKKAGVKVEEFGFGYPPRAFSIGKKWGTLFSLNWIPFGGFVKILGENYEDFSSPENQKCLTSATGASTRNFSAEKYPCISDLGAKKNLSFLEVSKKWQAIILSAGVFFNFVFAWLLLFLGFIIGIPTPVENSFGGEVKNPVLTVIEVLPESPAQNAGLKTGDKIKSFSVAGGEKITEPKSEEFSDFVNNSFQEINLEIDRGGEILNFEILPQTGLVEGKKLIGINMDEVGILSLPIHKAFYQSGKTTLQITGLTLKGFFNLIKDAIVGKADMSTITGPVGIVGLIGDASRLGFAYLITFTALISINLAILNLMPFPALDGGRLLFVAVEGIFKKQINPKFIQISNTIGFALLIALMLFITYRDILKLF